ncbi:hypothetical protein DOY81_002902 [Sarcophaga bullata]|nr:hypothetical protein DOY81_002902 [Sarcophaga bullata]
MQNENLINFFLNDKSAINNDDGKHLKRKKTVALNEYLIQQKKTKEKLVKH